MHPPADLDECIERMLRTVSETEQADLRRYLPREGYDDVILRVYLGNPFFRLTPDEIERIASGGADARLKGLVAARDAASRSMAPKYAVFCMPKSGSSFVSSALQYALELPTFSLTGVGSSKSSSYFGMNSREQELDELAISKATILSPSGFVSQIHTRCSAYLTLQLKLYRITPLLVVRNMLDAIVSFDDMMVAWRRAQEAEPWLSDAQFALPLNYENLEADRRYDLLGRSFGVWLINFYLSWKRCFRHGLVAPIVVRYETHVLDPDGFVRLVAGRIQMSDEQAARLAEYARTPDRERARFNVGVSGRGRALIPEHVRRQLLDYAGAFRDELNDEEIAYFLH